MGTDTSSNIGQEDGAGALVGGRRWRLFTSVSQYLSGCLQVGNGQGWREGEGLGEEKQQLVWATGSLGSMESLSL